MSKQCLNANVSTSRVSDMSPTKPDTFSLPASLPDWPPGLGFASGRIHLGEIEVLRISQFEFIWSSDLLDDKKKGVSFYKPLGAAPDGFHILGHYCHSNKQPLRGFLLLAREVASCESKASNTSPSVTSPALQRPLDYTLVWSSEDGSHGNFEGGFFWLPQPPEGYKAVGFLVTTRPERPDLDEVRCIRADLTDECQAYRLMLHAYSRLSDFPFQVWSIRPSHRGMLGRGVSVGTFFCSSYWTAEEPLNIACLRNFDSELHAMPNHEQIHSLINHYGPTVFFHPDETYLPSSVSWFFQNGALLYNSEDLIGQPIDANGSNLPGGGRNDGEFWIDLPRDERRDTMKCGNLETAKLYAHVKPAFGGTFTDIAMWVFCPFNGPATFKAGPVNISLGKIGQHVGDWEHFTLRICNFTGELWSIYFSQHSGGQWVEAYDLEYIEDNKAIVYSSKNGHASYPHPGTYLQGPSKLGIGIRNDACRSNLYVNSSTRYEIVAAEYLGADIEPGWLLFMREWGPKIVYSSRTKLDKIIKGLPLMLRYSVENIFKKFPLELYGEEGPTGPKEKNNWMGDERG